MVGNTHFINTYSADKPYESRSTFTGLVSGEYEEVVYFSSREVAIEEARNDARMPYCVSAGVWRVLPDGGHVLVFDSATE